MARKIVKRPTSQEVIDFLNAQTKEVSKREIARAFGLKGDDRVYLKHILKEIAKEGKLIKNKRHFSSEQADRNVRVEITGQDSRDAYIGRPLHWQDENIPQIIIRDSKQPLKIGDVVVCKLHFINQHLLTGEVQKHAFQAEGKMVGVVFDGKIMSVDRRIKEAFFMDNSFPKELKSGDIVLIQMPGNNQGNYAHFIEKIGSSNDAHIISLISIFTHHLAVHFSKESLKKAKLAKVPCLDSRKDLRAIPFVTIDGKDAKDFDDAVFVEADTDTQNKGGWHIYIGIADVSFYVRFGQALDKDAFLRGNSTYFPDRVLPMLPEELSNGVCSLNPNEERASLVCEVWIDKQGRKLKHRFERALIRSKRRLTYDEVESCFNGKMHLEGLCELMSSLKGCYESLKKARLARGVLEIDVPEMQVELNNQHQVESIHPRKRFVSHKMIEELMILANVSSAQTLEKLKYPVMYRVHDAPSEEKMHALYSYLKTSGFSMPKKETLMPRDFNALLEKTQDKSLNEVILRTQSQAEYSPVNIGHYGLALEKYAHFTSPIRRYADILVHRALVSGLKLGEGGLEKEQEKAFEQIAEHISATERQSASAEQDAIDRYVASFLSKRTGEVFEVRISSITPFGLFVCIDEYGADGLIPLSALKDDYYIYNEEKQILVGQETKKVFARGQKLEAILKEAVPLTGGLLLTPVPATRLKGSDSRVKKRPQKQNRKALHSKRKNNFHRK